MKDERDQDRGREPTFRDLPDEELLGLLDRAGLNVPDGVAREIVRRGASLVPELTRRMLDAEAWRRAHGFWSAVHALHLLGAIGKPEAAPALVELLRRDPGWEFLEEAMPSALSAMGEGALDPIAEYLAEGEGRGELRGGVAVSALIKIGHDQPSTRPRIASMLAELITSAEDRRCVSFAVSRAATVDDAPVVEAIEAAFARGAVDESIVSHEQVRSQRAEAGRKPWRASRAERDLLTHFTARQLSYLKSLYGDATKISSLSDAEVAARSRKRRKKGKKGKRRR